LVQQPDIQKLEAATPKVDQRYQLTGEDAAACHMLLAISPTPTHFFNPWTLEQVLPLCCIHPWSVRGVRFTMLADPVSQEETCPSKAGQSFVEC